MANVSSFSGAMPVIPGGLVELGYSEITADVSIDNATAGTGKEVIPAMTVICDGGPILVEFFSYAARPSSTAGDDMNISLFMDGSEYLRQWGRLYSPGTYLHPVHLQRKISPSAGSHTFGVKAYVTNAARTGAIAAGTGATTNAAPAFLRVSKIVNQNDGLKPFWTPPVVTSLPSQATEGDQVLRYRNPTSTNVFEPHQYASGSWRKLGTSIVPFCQVSRTAAGAVTTSTWTWVSWNTQDADTDDMFSPTDSKITINTPGVYAITLFGSFAPNSTGVRIMEIEKNAASENNGTRLTRLTVPAQATDDAFMTISRVAPLVAGDTLRATIWHNRGSDLNFGADGVMSVAWIGPIT